MHFLAKHQKTQTHEYAIYAGSKTEKPSPRIKSSRKNEQRSLKNPPAIFDNQSAYKIIFTSKPPTKIQCSDAKKTQK